MKKKNIFQPTCSTDRKRKIFEKSTGIRNALKTRGGFEKTRRHQKLVDRKRKLQKKVDRENARRQKTYRVVNRQAASETDVEQSYAPFESEEELAEAMAKVERALPKSPAKRKAVILALFYSLDEEDQRDIVESLTNY